MQMTQAVGRRQQTGFTLIEIMIVVVILGIVAAIAYPSYTRYVQRANEAEAQGLIMDLASRLEAHRAQRFSYQGATVASLSPELNANTNYTTTLALANSNQTYTITARPSPERMPGMPTLTYNSVTGPSWAAQ